MIYLVIYGTKENALYEDFPSLFSAQQWVAHHGGFIVQTVELVEKDNGQS